MGDHIPSNVDSTWKADPECYTQVAASPLVATYACTTPLTGRFLSVLLEDGLDTPYLTLCEVLVNGQSLAPSQLQPPLPPPSSPLDPPPSAPAPPQPPPPEPPLPPSPPPP